MPISTTAEPLVDVHVHLYPTKQEGQLAKDSYVIWEYGDDPGVEFATAEGDLEDLTAIYGKGGFTRAIVVHLFDTALARKDAAERLSINSKPAEMDAVQAEIQVAVGEAMLASNRWIAGVAGNDPLIDVLVSVDPTLLTPKEIADHVTDLAQLGVKGIKLHPVSQGYLPFDSRLHAIYETCSDAGLVVLSHSGPGHHGSASAKPTEFGSVLERWPNLKLVLAHLGGASWQETPALAKAFPQVMFDLSEIIEWSGASSAPTPDLMSMLIKEIGVDRVMMGSDFPWYDPIRTTDRVMGLPGLSTQERSALLGGNAARVFDI